MRPKILSDAEHIIWDWNGTLVNDLPLTHRAVLAVCEQLELAPIDCTEFRRLSRHPLLDFWKDIGFDEARHSYRVLAEIFLRSYESSCDEGLDLHDQVERILSSLRERRVGCSVLSAHVQELLDKRVDELGVRHFFQEIHGSRRRDGHGKIAEGKVLIEHISAPRERVLLIGDTTHDFEVAQSLGVACALVSRGSESEQRLLATGAPVFSSIAELFEID